MYCYRTAVNAMDKSPGQSKPEFIRYRTEAGEVLGINKPESDTAPEDESSSEAPSSSEDHEQDGEGEAPAKRRNRATEKANKNATGKHESPNPPLTSRN